MAATPKRSQLFKDLDKCVNRNRFSGWWSLLILPYIPFGVILTVLRLCLSLQVILLLMVIPEGALKRFMLRVSIGILGIVVTTEGNNRNPKVFIANKLSSIDNIVLHLSATCQTVSVEGTSSYPVTFLFNHQSLKSQDDESMANQLATELQDCVDYTSLAVQPEPVPTYGQSILKFRSWPFMLDCPVQPVVLSAYRLWPLRITKANSSGWWDLLWTLFVPFTYYHVRFLDSCECGKDESKEEFATRVQGIMAAALEVRALAAGAADVKEWLKAPPKPSPPATPKPVSMPTGPVIPIAEYDKIKPTVGGADHASPEIEAMVQQVTAVMPQVPHTAIRQDLVSTRSVDQTITNILEGRVKYGPIPTLHEATGGSVRSGASDSVRSGGRDGVKSSPSGSLFKSRSAHLSLQRHTSLEERKQLLLEQARRRYIEKHGPR